MQSTQRMPFDRLALVAKGAGSPELHKNVIIRQFLGDYNNCLGTADSGLKPRSSYEKALFT